MYHTNKPNGTVWRVTRHTVALVLGCARIDQGPNALLAGSKRQAAGLQLMRVYDGGMRHAPGDTLLSRFATRCLRRMAHHKQFLCMWQPLPQVAQVT